jgi:hypothetical protein
MTFTHARHSIGLLAATTAIAVGAAGAAQAAAPSATLSFSPATISAGTQPDMTFIGSDVPSGATLYLQESADGGQQWKTVDRTDRTQGSSNLAALSEGVYQFRIVIVNGNTALAASEPATLTVTGPGGATPTPVPVVTPAAAATAPPPAPSGTGVPWLDSIVEPVWHAILIAIIAWILSLF